MMKHFQKYFHKTIFKFVLFCTIGSLLIFFKFRKEFLSLKNDLLYTNLMFKVSTLDANLRNCEEMFHINKIKNYHDSCKGLFKSGTIVPKCHQGDNNKSSCATNRAEEWSPNGCKLRHYSNKDLETCFNKYSKFGRKMIYMFGDSRIRHLFEAFKSRLLGKPVDTTIYGSRRIHHFKTSDIYLNFQGILFTDENLFQFLLKILEKEDSPILVFLGNSLHTIQNHKHNQMDGLEEYKQNLTRLRTIMNYMSRSTKVVWMVQPPVIKNGQWIGDRIAQRVQLVDLYNDVAVLSNSGVAIMESVTQIGNATISRYKDETHLGSEADGIIIEMLINYICNNQLETEEKFCCS